MSLMDGDYELVGVVEVARLLGVDPKLIPWWLTKGRFHPPVDYGPPPLWDRYEVEAWAEGSGAWPGGAAAAEDVPD